MLLSSVPGRPHCSLWCANFPSGANRGLGLGLLKVFKEQGYNVFGTIRPQTRSDASFKDVSQMLPMLRAFI